MTGKSSRNTPEGDRAREAEKARPEPEPSERYRDDEEVELSESGGIVPPERSPDDYHDRTRDRELNE